MAKVGIKYNPNKPQRAFDQQLKYYMAMMFGGYGSGKTYSLVQKSIKLSAINRGFAGGLVCPSYTDYKRDVLPTFIDILEQNGLLPYTKIHQTEKWIKFPWSKAPLYFFTAEKPIKGPNLAYMGFNEFSLMPFERIQEGIARVRVKGAPLKQINFAGTPEDEYGWLEEFIEKQHNAGKLWTIQAKTTDNEHLDPEYVEHLRDTLDPLQFRLYAMGEMISLGTDLFYYSYQSHINEAPVTFLPNERIYVNMDFNVANMFTTMCHKFGEGENMTSIFFDEIHLTSHGSNTHEMIRAIKARYPDHIQDMLITCDFAGASRKTTGPSDVKVLYEAFGKENVRYKTTGNTRLRKRQILVNGLLANGKILLNAKKCPKLKKDFQKVVQLSDYTKDKKKNPDLTHASDTVDYYCDFEYEIKDRRSFVHKVL